MPGKKKNPNIFQIVFQEGSPILLQDSGLFVFEEGEFWNYLGFIIPYGKIKGRTSVSIFWPNHTKIEGPSAICQLKIPRFKVHWTTESYSIDSRTRCPQTSYFSPLLPMGEQKSLLSPMQSQLPTTQEKAVIGQKPPNANRTYKCNRTNLKSDSPSRTTAQYDKPNTTSARPKNARQTNKGHICKLKKKKKSMEKHGNQVKPARQASTKAVNQTWQHSLPLQHTQCFPQGRPQKARGRGNWVLSLQSAAYIVTIITVFLPPM